MNILRPKLWTQKPTLGTQINRNHPLAKGLVGLWMLREGGGSTVYDSSGSNNAGTLTGGPTWIAGRNGKALSLNGTSQYLDTPANLSVLTPNAGTISVWAYNSRAFNAAQGDQLLGNANNNIQGLRFGDGNIYFGFVNNGRVIVAATATNWPQNKWTLYTLTYTTGTKSMTLYVNGVFAGTDAGTNVSVPNTSLIVGKGFDAFYTGSIDDVRIYNRALSVQEIQRLYTNPYEIFVPQAPKFKYWVTTSAGIQFDAASNSGVQTAQSTYTFNRTCSGSNRFLAVDIALLSAGQTVTSVLDDFQVSGGTGNAMTFIGARSTVTSFGRIETWGIVAPPTGTKVIQVNLSGSVTSTGLAVSYTNVHQTLPYEAFNSNQATNVGAADATVDITPIADNCWVHAALAASDASVTANQTSRNNVSDAVTVSGADEDTGPIHPAALTTMSYTGVGAGVTWAIAGYAIRPTTASGPVSGNFSTSKFWMLLGLGT